MSGLIGKLSFETDETGARPAPEQKPDALRHHGSGTPGHVPSPGIAPVDGDAVESPTTYALSNVA